MFLIEIVKCCVRGIHIRQYKINLLEPSLSCSPCTHYDLNVRGHTLSMTATGRGESEKAQRVRSLSTLRIQEGEGGKKETKTAVPSK